MLASIWFDSVTHSLKRELLQSEVAKRQNGEAGVSCPTGHKASFMWSFGYPWTPCDETKTQAQKGPGIPKGMSGLNASDLDCQNAIGLVQTSTISPGNGWGKPPEWRLRHDLMRNPVLEVRTRFGNQGYNCEWVSLVELAYDRPIIRLPTIVAGYDNTGASDDGLGQSTTAVVDPQPGGGFVLRYLGSRPGHVSYVAGKRGYRPQGPQPLRECSG